MANLYYQGRGGRSFAVRWDDVHRLADFRETDRVLDVGCAEGLITLEVAKLVESIHGIDVVDDRIDEAKRLAAERRIVNATFELASIIDYPLEPRSYDVTMFMAVWGKLTKDGGGRRRVGPDELARILEATRRQLVMRVTVQLRPEYEPLLEEILDICDEHDFDALCFSRSTPKRERDEEDRAPGRSGGANMLIANRRGTDARVGEVPPLVLVPAAMIADHPIIQSAQSPPVRRKAR